MVQGLALLYFCVAGFAAAGLLASLAQAITARPPQFMISSETMVGGLGGAVVCVFGGPFIIMRNAIRGRLLERRHAGWLVASSVIALIWSGCSGIVLIDVAQTLQGTLG